jgi:hypothetical protein
MSYLPQGAISPQEAANLLGKQQTTTKTTTTKSSGGTLDKILGASGDVFKYLTSRQERQAQEAQAKAAAAAAMAAGQKPPMNWVPIVAIGGVGLLAVLLITRKK